MFLLPSPYLLPHYFFFRFKAHKGLCFRPITKLHELRHEKCLAHGASRNNNQNLAKR